MNTCTEPKFLLSFAIGTIKKVISSSAPGERKVSTSSKSGIKQPSKPVEPVAQGTSKQSSRLSKLPPRRSTRGSSTTDAPRKSVVDGPFKEDQLDGQASTQQVSRQDSHPQRLMLHGRDAKGLVGVSSRHGAYQPSTLTPDILSETPEVNKHSVGVQIEDEEGKRALQELQSKAKDLEMLLRQQKDYCHSLEESVKEMDMDCIAAAIVMNVLGRKVSA